jgi:hypothetical protein
VTPQEEPAHLRFAAYFNVADELYSSRQELPPLRLSLEDLEEDWVALAQQAAQELDLPWPPILTAAEEFALSHPEFVRGEDGW